MDSGKVYTDMYPLIPLQLAPFPPAALEPALGIFYHPAAPIGQLRGQAVIRGSIIYPYLGGIAVVR